MSDTKHVLVPLAPGFEEIEATTIIDILRRAGANVIVAGLNSKTVQGSHDIIISADALLEEIKNEEWDMIVLPGGVPGTPNLSNDQRVIQILKSLFEKGKYTTAICAAPSVLEKAGLTKGKNITSAPGWADQMTSAHHTGARVEEDGLIITSKSCGTAMEFAFRLVKVLFGEAVVEEVNASVLAKL
ncbi:DJ-1 family glyoxalase III [Candidatus Neomarinimicrobiota bacterium]